MADFNYREFFKSVTGAPLVLILGQDVLRSYGGDDFFLAACKSRFNLPKSEDYQDLIGHCGDSQEVVSIWHNISSRIAVPEALEKVAALPWNCVLTSAIHDVVERAVAKDWRSVVPVLNEQEIPADPRSRDEDSAASKETRR